MLKTITYMVSLDKPAIVIYHTQVNEAGADKSGEEIIMLTDKWVLSATETLIQKTN